LQRASRDEKTLWIFTFKEINFIRFYFAVEFGWDDSKLTLLLKALDPGEGKKNKLPQG